MSSGLIMPAEEPKVQIKSADDFTSLLQGAIDNQEQENDSEKAVISDAKVIASVYISDQIPSLALHDAVEMKCSWCLKLENVIGFQEGSHYFQWS